MACINFKKEGRICLIQFHDDAGRWSQWWRCGLLGKEMLHWVDCYILCMFLKSILICLLSLIKIKRYLFLLNRCYKSLYWIMFGVNLFLFDWSVLASIIYNGKMPPISPYPLLLWWNFNDQYQVISSRGVQNNIDILSLSYTRHAEDVRHVRIFRLRLVFYYLFSL